jgi:hypothetical protein
MRDFVSLTESRHFAMLIKVYIDDSADGKQEKVIAAGAFSGDYRQWMKLVSPWKRRLKRAGMKYFRATEYYSLRGEFEHFRDPVKYPIPKGSEAARALRDDLDHIIKTSKIIGIAHCIPLAVYKEVRENEPHGKDIFPEDPFEAALQSLIRDCAKEFKKHYGNKHRLAFVCDSGPNSARIAKVYSSFKQAHPDFGDIIGGLVHGDDKQYPQLQAADLMAHLAREMFTPLLENPEPTAWTRLNSSIYFSRHWNRDVMMQLLNYGQEARA